MKYYVLGMESHNQKDKNSFKLLQSLISSFKINATSDSYHVYLYERLNINSVLLHLAHHINDLADVDGFEFLYGTLTHSIAEYIEYYSKEEEHLLLFKDDMEKEFGIKLERAISPIENNGIIKTLNIQRYSITNSNGDISRFMSHTFKFKGVHNKMPDKVKRIWIIHTFMEFDTFSESVGQSFQSSFEIVRMKKNEWKCVESWTRDL